MTKTSKKPPAKKATATKASQKTDSKTEQMIISAVGELRKNPKKYEALRASLKKARSDKERVNHLLKYATSDRKLAAMLPPKTGGTTELAWTTITITTVFIPSTAS